METKRTFSESFCAFILTSELMKKRLGSSNKYCGLIVKNFLQVSNHFCFKIKTSQN